VKGMSKAKLKALKDKVTVAQEKAAAPPAKPAPVTAAPAMPPAATKPTTAQEPAAPAKPAAAAKEKGTAAKMDPGQKVNINTASKEDLDKLFDIGPVKAQAIIDGRPYQKIEDVKKVKGIKGGIFSRIKDNITVD
jgi:competence protein ComEA